LIVRLEARRLELGLTQGAVALVLGVTQPHYSKIVGGIVPLTPNRATIVEAWLKDALRDAEPVPGSDRAVRIREIRKVTRSIQSQLRQLAKLLVAEGGSSRRPLRRTSRRTRKMV
jgi:transcriptional regulator with XRE-family HTH domain